MANPKLSILVSKFSAWQGLLISIPKCFISSTNTLDILRFHTPRFSKINSGGHIEKWKNLTNFSHCAVCTPKIESVIHQFNISKECDPPKSWECDSHFSILKLRVWFTFSGDPVVKKWISRFFLKLILLPIFTKKPILGCLYNFSN